MNTERGASDGEDDNDTADQQMLIMERPAAASRPVEEICFPQEELGQQQQHLGGEHQTMTGHRQQFGIQGSIDSSSIFQALSEVGRSLAQSSEEAPTEPSTSTSQVYEGVAAHRRAQAALSGQESRNERRDELVSVQARVLQLREENEKLESILRLVQQQQLRRQGAAEDSDMMTNESSAVQDEQTQLQDGTLVSNHGLSSLVSLLSRHVGGALNASGAGTISTTTSGADGGGNSLQQGSTFTSTSVRDKNIPLIRGSVPQPTMAQESSRIPQSMSVGHEKSPPAPQQQNDTLLRAWLSSFLEHQSSHGGEQSIPITGHATVKNNNYSSSNSAGAAVALVLQELLRRQTSARPQHKDPSSSQKQQEWQQEGQVNLGNLSEEQQQILVALLQQALVTNTSTLDPHHGPGGATTRATSHGASAPPAAAVPAALLTAPTQQTVSITNPLSILVENMSDDQKIALIFQELESRISRGTSAISTNLRDATKSQGQPLETGGEPQCEQQSPFTNSLPQQQQQQVALLIQALLAHTCAAATTANHCPPHDCILQTPTSIHHPAQGQQGAGTLSAPDQQTAAAVLCELLSNTVGQQEQQQANEPPHTHVAFGQAKGWDLSSSNPSTKRQRTEASVASFSSQQARSSETAASGKRGALKDDAETIPEPRGYRRKKKDSDQPTRPLSAYNLYFRDTRAKLLLEQKRLQQEADEAEQRAQQKGGRKSASADSGGGRDSQQEVPSLPPKLDFATMTKHVAAGWKQADKATREHYKNMAEQDVGRYQKEMEEYQERERQAREQSMQEKSEENADKETE